MSQYKFERGNLTFTTGWDRPLRYFYLLIESSGPCEDTDVESYLFNNLDRANPAMTLDEVKMICKAHGGDLPADIEAKMMRDSENG